jgi:hypothetical protein
MDTTKIRVADDAISQGGTQEETILAFFLAELPGT